MAHAIHQLAEGRASRGGQHVSGVAQIMKVGALKPGTGQGRKPAPAPEVAMMKRRAGRAREHQRISRRPAEGGEMSGQLRLDGSRDDDYAAASL
jgi:hypothetical protein